MYYQDQNKNLLAVFTDLRTRIDIDMSESEHFAYSQNIFVLKLDNYQPFLLISE